MEQMTQKVVPVLGSHVSVDVYGEPDGPAVVIVPGVMADAAAWGPVARALHSWPTVAVVNRRGRRPSGELSSAYSLAVEVQDALTVLQVFADVRALFGWSFGALIALHAANERAMPHVIGYEPIIAPFGSKALPSLRQADVDDDQDARVEVALREVAGVSDDVIEDLREQGLVWAELRRLSTPIVAETQAINTAGRSAALASRADRVDLIVGARNQGRAPYGTTFDDVVRQCSAAAVHVLPGHGYLAHLEAPAELAAFIDAIARGVVEPGSLA